MSPEQITHIMQETLYLALQLAAPFLLTALVVGLAISLLQSFTQIQEMTLTFVPKMLIIAFMIALLFPWMLKMMTKFSHNIFIYQWDKVIQ